MGVYLLGLLLGGLYVGMIAPVRTVIQEDFGLDDSAGVWMISVYTLFYAALIAVIGNLADRQGRKPVFLTCVALFATGLVACGLSAYFGGFGLLLAGRIVQAVGACGMIPIANAEIGTSFPSERRGAMLGVAAAVMGLANVMGAAVGSALLGVLGNDRWPWLFFGCLPAVAVLMAAAVLALPDRLAESRGKLDVAGSALLVAMVLSLLLGMRSLDILDLAASFARLDVLVPLALACVGGIAFVAVEGSAENPVFHLEYLRSRAIVVTMVASFFIGCIVITMQLVPEFAEVATGSATGSGGYFLTIIGVFSLFGPPLAGRLVDRLGPKPVLVAGLAVTAAGYVFLATVGTGRPTIPVLVVGLAVVGLGMGFSMGAPTNYMVLANTSPDESTSAIATITLVRQVGTSLAPALLAGLITSAPGLEGYARMLLCAAAFGAIALVVTLLYPHSSAG